MKVQFQSRNRRKEQGYILLTLLLFVTILIITMAIVVPQVTFQVKRDREEEMIHRGVQYSRAIRRYVKKFGRYPTRIEDLENTNNLRFLRRRYKDPITGKDFKLLHVGEVQMMPGSGLAGATPVSAMPGATALGQQPPQSLNQPAQPQAAKNDENKDENHDQTNGDSQQSDQPKGATNAGGDALSGQVFGGGPIVGVASTSKAQTIREFNHKNHYNQWQFIYDPSTDRGGLLNTPAQPPLQGATPVAGAPVPGMQSPQQGQPQQGQPLSAPPANMPPPTSDQQPQQ
jgi:type II secretory pathway pseudopilin PulG